MEQIQRLTSESLKFRVALTALSAEGVPNGVKRAVLMMKRGQKKASTKAASVSSDNKLTWDDDITQVVTVYFQLVDGNLQATSKEYSLKVKSVPMRKTLGKVKVDISKHIKLESSSRSWLELQTSSSIRLFLLVSAQLVDEQQPIQRSQSATLPSTTSGSQSHADPHEREENDDDEEDDDDDDAYDDASNPFLGKSYSPSMAAQMAAVSTPIDRGGYGGYGGGGYGNTPPRADSHDGVVGEENGEEEEDDGYGASNPFMAAAAAASPKDSAVSSKEEAETLIQESIDVLHSSSSEPDSDAERKGAGGFSSAWKKIARRMTPSAPRTAEPAAGVGAMKGLGRRHTVSVLGSPDFEFGGTRLFEPESKSTPLPTTAKEGELRKLRDENRMLREEIYILRSQQQQQQSGGSQGGGGGRWRGARARAFRAMCLRTSSRPSFGWQRRRRSSTS